MAVPFTPDGRPLDSPIHQLLQIEYLLKELLTLLRLNGWTAMNGFPPSFGNAVMVPPQMGRHNAGRINVDEIHFNQVLEAAMYFQSQRLSARPDVVVSCTGSQSAGPRNGNGNATPHIGHATPRIGNVMARDVGIGNAMARDVGIGNAMARDVGNGNDMARNVGNGNAMARDVGNGNAMARDVGNGNAMARDVGNGNATARDVGNGNATARDVGNGNATARDVGNGNATARDVGNGNAIPHYVGNGNAIPHYVGNGNAIPHYVGNGNAMPHYVGNGNAMPHYVGNGNAMPHYVGNGNAMPRDGGNGNATSRDGGGNGNATSRDGGGNGNATSRDARTAAAAPRPQNRTLTLQVELCPECYYDGNDRKLKVVGVTRVENKTDDGVPVIEEENATDWLRNLHHACRSADPSTVDRHHRHHVGRQQQNGATSHIQERGLNVIRRLASVIQRESLETSVLTAIFVIAGWKMLIKK